MNKKKQLIRKIRRSKKAKIETNNTAHNKTMCKASTGACMYCPPWKGDNQVMRINKKHGAKKPKYKNKRK